MNQITAFVHDIKSVENLNIVTFDVNYHVLKMMSLDLDKSIQKGTKAILTCKPTSVAIAKNISGELSYSNQLKVTISSINSGELLCVLELVFDDFTIESIITTESQKRMQLAQGDEVIALIKSSDLFIERFL